MTNGYMLTFDHVLTYVFTSAQKAVMHLVDTRLDECGWYLRSEANQTVPFGIGPVAPQIIQKVKNGLGVVGLSDTRPFSLTQIQINPPAPESRHKVY
jgi:hypothetical protein